MSKEFTFDEATHTYRLGNKILPSVTQIISDLNDFSMIPPHVLEMKSQLGSEMHRIIHLHFLDDLVYDTIDQRLVKAFNTFLEWSNPRLEEFKKGLSEHRMYNEKSELCGTCDLALPSELYDYKLRDPKPVVDVLQLEGYDFLLGGGKRKRFTVCFDMKSGRMKITRSEHDQAHAMFHYFLDYFHSDKKDEKKHLEMLENWKGEFK